MKIIVICQTYHYVKGSKIDQQFSFFPGVDSRASNSSLKPPHASEQIRVIMVKTLW
jgi:hypothetical protein